MSDFVYSSLRRPPGDLARGFDSICPAVDVREFHGEWGSLALTPPVYTFETPVENEQHVNFSIGPTSSHPGTTKPGSERGPRLDVALDKRNHSLTVVTDELMAVAVYATSSGPLLVSSHVDVLARCHSSSPDFDPASLVDFILHGKITYPYTAYKGLHLLAPGSRTTYYMAGGRCERREVSSYWKPTEGGFDGSLVEAADAMRDSLTTYIRQHSEEQGSVAILLSGGEDSRIVSSVLASRSETYAITLVGAHNRESRIAAHVAARHGHDHTIAIQPPSYYLDILEGGTRWAGSSHQYFHAHSLGLRAELGLDRFKAVFGGWGSDSLLKGFYRPQPALTRYVPLLPQTKREWHRRGAGRGRPAGPFSAEVNEIVRHRRAAHLDLVAEMRPHSATEWFHLYPLTMCEGSANLAVARRLYRAHEPFLSSGVVRLAASIPNDWKLNRGVFVRLARPLLESTSGIRHADGRRPEKNWLANLPNQAPVWAWMTLRKLARRVGAPLPEDGSWKDWNVLTRSTAWRGRESKLSTNLDALPLAGSEAGESLTRVGLTAVQRANLLQVLWMLEGERRF